MKLSKLKSCVFDSQGLILLVLALFFSACSKKAIVQSGIQKEKEIAVKEQIIKPLQYPEDRLIDILHTKLELSFDWEKQEVIGSEILTIKSYLDSINSFYLDAKGLGFTKVEVSIAGQPLDFSYEYDSLRIYFDLKNYLKSTDLLILKINYIARPSQFSDSLAPENRGLFFINPMDTIPNLNRQIWTQGEPFYNSVWFPTLERPDEKFTQEIYLTVDTSMTTLSNGKLVTKRFNPNGSRTDYWHQDKPHSSYLTMIAVGDWEEIELTSQEIPLTVLSEKKYENSIDDVFKNTSEMLEFFERTFSYPYPWDKYAQVAVRKFITGAMENTGASVFNDQLYVDSRTLIDYNFDWIISHELAHQWFGNLVTAKSWSYISLNEAFANYAEYLWAEYKNGDEAAGLVRISELDDYLSEAESERKAIVRYRYIHPDEMFDAHNYSKGGLALHMLRKELSDEVFFKSIGIYLKRHAYKNVELSDLRKVFEEVSGKNLELFFEQWFLKPGHPNLKISNSASDSLGQRIRIEQTQIEENFVMPITLRWLNQDGTFRDTLVVQSKKEMDINWKSIQSKGTLIVDPDHALLATIEHTKSYEELTLQYKMSNDFLTRYEAFTILIDSFPDRVKSSGIIQQFIGDKYYTIQEMALNFISENYEVLSNDIQNKILSLAQTSKKSYVRGSAVETLNYLGYSDTLFYSKILTDSSWYVCSMALEALTEHKKDSLELDKIIDSFESSEDPHITNVVASYYASSLEDKSAWFEQKLSSLKSQDTYSILGYYGLALTKTNSEKQKEGIEKLLKVASEDEYYFNRVMAFQSLLVFIDNPGMKERLVEILNQEDSIELRKWIQNML